MKLAGAPVLLCAALLLIPGRNCDICSAVTDDVNLFLTGTTDNYVDYVAKFQKNQLILDNARKLKNCVDTKLTEEDKKHVLSALKKIYSSPLC
ncbi:PREDICTED: major allergen I polypeptide chain 1-like [Galeopterus variegatus]|uniref:Major allergen I polypeptide chain 1-like n=1 Tax=Galeopterus variegatus TaxID=482537 RepID=A0ABM0QX32_GALVR|nr:PREDICTED: major allergen I polypeptide chain 1-like [Galeopterus variegatus]